MRLTPRLIKSLTAVVLAFALIALSPGLPCYEAIANDFNGGAPKGVDIKTLPVLELNQVKTGSLQLPGQQLPGGVPQVGVPQGVEQIPVLNPVPGLTGTTQIQEGAGNIPAGPKSEERPSAETTLRLGEQAITGAAAGDQGGKIAAFWNHELERGGDAVNSDSSFNKTLQLPELAAIAKDQTRPAIERLTAVKAIANRSDDPAKLALEEIGTVKPVGDAADYEIRRQALRALAGKGKVVSLPAISEQHKAEILAKLSANKPKTAVFDWHGTWEEGSAKASAETGAALKAMADARSKVVIETGGPFEARDTGRTSIVESLSSLKPEQLAAIEVLSDRGARSLSFTDGKARVTREEPGWTAEEKTQLDATAARVDEYTYALQVPGGVNLEDAAAELQSKLDKSGLKAFVAPRLARGERAAQLIINKYDKSTGLKAIGAQGSSTVLVGDWFFGPGNADGPMTHGAPGALALSIGGSADPRLENIYVWDKTGREGTLEIAAAVAKTAPSRISSVFKLAEVGKRASGLVGWLKSKWNAEGPKPPAPDDPVNVKTLLGNIVPSVISMAAYMLVTLAFVGVAVPAVGWTGYGILMSLSPMAGIAAANIMGNMFKKMGARNAMAINTALRIVSLSALPLLHLFGPVGMGALLVGALAEGFLLSSIMTTSGSFMPALFPSKQIGNINGVMFMMFPLVQVILGLWAHVGRFADLMSPFTIFAGAAALNAFIVLPLTWLLIPNTKLTTNQPASVGAAAAPKASVAQRLKDFVKKFWKPMLGLGLAVGLFAGLTWGLPALAAAGVGGKLIAGAAAFLKVHSSLTAPLPIVAALVYWISRTDGFKALKEGKAASVPDAQKALQQKVSDLEAAGPEKAGELAAARKELSYYSGRQLKSIGLMSLSTLMYYPLYLVAAPHVAEVLAGTTGKLELAGQFLGALFFGSLISTIARTKLPGKKIKFLGEDTTLTTVLAQAGVTLLAGLFAATKIFVASTVLGGIGVGVGAAVAAAGLIYLAQRITDRGWIKGAGVGFAAIWLPFVVWSWPALIPFLTVKTAMLLSLLAAGYVNGPNFVSLISYLMGNTERSENSKVTGVQGAFFNAAISTGYALLTIASGFLNPAYPAVLAILGVANLLIGGYFWKAVSHLPGISPTIFKPKTKKPTETPK